MPPIAERRRGEDTSQVRATPASSAQVQSQSTAMAQKIAPSRSSWTATEPAAGSTNCGSTAMKKTITFGLNTPTRKPSARIRRSTFGSTGVCSAAASERRWRKACTPRYARYAAPRSLIAVKTAIDSCTSAPSPKATAMTCT